MSWLSQRIKKASSHQNFIFESGVNDLIFTSRNKKKVVLQDGQQVIEFMSCSYLGLECDQRLTDAAVKSTLQNGVQFAAARTRLRPHSTIELETKLSKIFSGPTITYATVGLTHLATLPLLGAGELPTYPVKNQPLWILDRTTHASIQVLRGILNQFGEVLRVDFQNSSQLKNAFETAFRCGLTPITISDGIGSMGGQAPVKLLFELAEDYNGYCYLDDAHGTSIMGRFGGGFVLQELGDQFHPRLILASSLSKAFGATGGSVTLYSEEDAKVMRRFSVPYTFGGPLSLPGVAAGVASADIHLSDELRNLQQQLREKCELFDKLSNSVVINRDSLFPIRGFLVGNEFTAIQIGKKLLEKGFACTTALFPTVPKGEAMIRVALSTLHADFEIAKLIREFEHQLANRLSKGVQNGLSNEL